MFHSYDDYKKYFSSFKDGLIELRNSNKIKKIGVSLHSNDEIIEVLKNGHIDIIQLPFNLLDNSNQREKILLKAKSMGIEIHTRSVFLQGLFFKDPNKITGNILEIKVDLNRLNSLVSKEKMNDLALNYVYSKEYIDGVLLGVDNVGQLKNNLSCINDDKFKDIIENIDSINVKEENLLNPANW
jgi:aryl-alcohol dehydrogenase-like predicted oxidoreductase